MASAPSPLAAPLAPAHDRAHGHSAPAEPRPAAGATLLTSGIARRLGVAAGLVALLWLVVLWALA
jgi:hypothetical protein